MSTLVSDERLVRRAVGGEERALAAIFDRYHQRLYRYCLAILGDSQDAQDALQNTMLKVLRALPGEKREIKLRPWLYRIAHNESIELLRRRRETRQLDAELAAPGPSLADDLSARQRLRQLLSDLDQLPERQRGALVMRELGGLDAEGIAAALGTSAAVARQTLYEARLSLHQMDEGRDMDCAIVTRAISDGDGRVIRRRDVRAHLRSCPDCRRFRAEIEGREQDLAALAPLPAVAAGGILQALLGGGASTGGSGAAGAVVAGGAAKALSSSAALKGAATVLAIAAIGTGAAERGGLIDLGLPGGGTSQTSSQHAFGPSAGGDGNAGATSAATPAAGSQGSTGVKEPASSPGVAGGQSAKPGQASTPASGGSHEGSGGQEGAQASPVAARGEPTAHPHGKGHEKQQPAAAAHGQQTAAAHKQAGQGATGKGRTSHPEHPSHAVHPTQPSSDGETGPPAKGAGPAENKGESAGGGSTVPAGTEDATEEP
jgi:RNA polymerase sigma factor (sigma-70 family)